MKNQNRLIDFLLYLLLILFSFGNFARISFNGQQINGYLYEFILFILILFLLVKDKFQSIVKGYKENRYLFWFFIVTFIAYFFCLKYYSHQENIIGFLYQIRISSYFLFYFLIRKYSLKKPLNVFIFLTILFSLVQYLFYPDLRNLLYQGWDPHLFRVFGTYLDTYVAVSIYGLIFFYLYFQKKTVFNKLLLMVFFVLVMLTFSRIGYTAFFLTLVFILLKKDIRRIFLIIFLIAGVLIIVPKPFGEGVNLTRVFSIQSRIADYRTAINSWKTAPVFGIGYNRIRYFKKQNGLINQDQFAVSHSGASFHSSFLIILVTTGIVGLGLFILSLVKLGSVNFYSRYFLTYVGIISLADNSLLHPFILLMLLILISLSHKLR